MDQGAGFLGRLIHAQSERQSVRSCNRSSMMHKLAAMPLPKSIANKPRPATILDCAFATDSVCACPSSSPPRPAMQTSDGGGPGTPSVRNGRVEFWRSATMERRPGPLKDLGRAVNSKLKV